MSCRFFTSINGTDWSPDPKRVKFEVVGPLTGLGLLRAVCTYQGRAVSWRCAVFPIATMIPPAPFP